MIRWLEIFFFWFVRIQKKFHMHADSRTPMDAPVLSGVLMQFCFVLSWHFLFLFCIYIRSNSACRIEKNESLPSKRKGQKGDPGTTKRHLLLTLKLIQPLNPAIIWCHNSPQHHCLSASSWKRCLKPWRIFYRPNSDPTNAHGAATA